jgi:hypothetical protein
VEDPHFADKWRSSVGIVRLQTKGNRICLSCLGTVQPTAGQDECLPESQWGLYVRIGCI